MDTSRSAPIITATAFIIDKLVFEDTESIDAYALENNRSNPTLCDFTITWPDKTDQTFALNWSLEDLVKIKNIFYLPTKKQQQNLLNKVSDASTEASQKAKKRRNRSLSINHSLMCIRANIQFLRSVRNDNGK